MPKKKKTALKVLISYERLYRMTIVVGNSALLAQFPISDFFTPASFVPETLRSSAFNHEL